MWNNLIIAVDSARSWHLVCYAFVKVTAVKITAQVELFKIKGAVTLCNFPCNLHCLAMPLWDNWLRKLQHCSNLQRHFTVYHPFSNFPCNLSCKAVVRQAAEKIAALQQLATPLHSVSPLQQLSSQFLRHSPTAHAQSYLRLFLSNVFPRQSLWEFSSR